ncbi:hypothetical protein MPER_11461 [Moniliophthora perniciosa FA553]|nr:hypothetical protein MPER_11461 [Moniliophthora perniciosa FA553]
MDTTSFRILHHFTIATSHSFFSDLAFTSAFRNTVPQLSWQNPHLVHTILSCTALHLGRLYPKDSEPNWLYRASAHRKAAIDALPSATNPDAKYLAIGCFPSLVRSSVMQLVCRSPGKISVVM